MRYVQKSRSGHKCSPFWTLAETLITITNTAFMKHYSKPKGRAPAYSQVRQELLMESLPPLDAK